MPLFGKKDDKSTPAGKAAEMLTEPEAPPPTDPRCPLNARQVFRIKKSWKGVKRDLSAAGVEMMIR